MNDTYESRDKQIVPFLLTQPKIKYLGNIRRGSVVYFSFTPNDICVELVNAFASRKAPLVQPKDLLDAVETFRDVIFQMKEKGRDYGTST